MLLQLLTIARNTFIEALRQPITFFLIVIAGLMEVLSTWGAGFSMGRSTTAEVSADNKMLLEIGLASIFGIGMLLAAFIATAVISREIENKTALTVVSKPVPRWVVVIGKYLGISGVMILAIVTMLLFLMLSIRHGVMSTASDHIDGPVLTFALSGFALSLLLAVWCNFFYGWSFSQTAIVALLPATALAYLLVLGIDNEWAWQPLTTDLKPQIMLACFAVLLAVLVLTAVATAASTRLGQVMTILICAGVFMFGLLVDHLVGRHAFENTLIAMVDASTSEDPKDTSFTKTGSRYTIELDGPPATPIKPGDSLYYGSNPNGFALAVPPFPPFRGDLSKSVDLLGPSVPGGIIVTEVDDRLITITHIGGSPLRIKRPPMVGDSIFLGPTRVNRLALGTWSVIPNMQYFWLTDAIAQNHPVPASHIARLVSYAALQIAAFLLLGVALFQTRDMG